MLKHSDLVGMLSQARTLTLTLTPTPTPTLALALARTQTGWLDGRPALQDARGRPLRPHQRGLLQDAHRGRREERQEAGAEDPRTLTPTRPTVTRTRPPLSRVLPNSNPIPCEPSEPESEPESSPEQEQKTISGGQTTSLNVAKYRQLFGLPKEEALSLRTTCSMRKEQNALKDTTVQFGDLYVFEAHPDPDPDPDPNPNPNPSPKQT